MKSPDPNACLRLRLSWRMAGAMLLLASVVQAQLPDSLRQPLDTLVPPGQVVTQALPLSQDALETGAKYSAKDLTRLDLVNERVYLYGEAKIEYATVTLTAGYIEYDMRTNTVLATYRQDSSGRKSQLPVFTEGSNTPITAEQMRYNFVTKKGKIFGASTTQAGGYVRSGEAKIVGRQDSVAHSSDEIYGQDAIYTTCDHPEPHFGLRSSKQKVIPNKLVVVGPSNIEIMGIPTPLWLPFGFFPLTEGQSSGLIFPRDYEYSPSWGYGLRNVGWYFGLGEKADLQVLGDVYTRGSWGLRGTMRYKTRYKYAGDVTLGYSRRISGDLLADPNAEVRNAVKVVWNHNQDNKAHPYRTFRGNVNVETNNFERDNFNDAQSVLNSELTSNVYVTQRFANAPVSVSLSVGHSQNVNTRDIRFNLPTLDVNMQRVFPFKDSRPGEDRWYEKIGLTYTGKIQNTITGKDSLLNRPDSLSFRYGAQHSVPINANFKVLKYFNVSPYVNYSERWFLRTLERQFIDELTVDVDTLFDADRNPIDIRRDTTFGRIEDLTNNGFRSLREVNAGISVNTQLFGMMRFRRGPVRAIRHTFKPSVSVNYTPDYTREFWGYWDQVQYDTRYPDEYRDYNVFQGGLFGQASLGGTQTIGYNIVNILEAKVRNNRDTLNPVQKVRLINNFTLSGNYNMAADSFRMSVITANGNTTVFKKINVSFGFTADPLAANPANDQRIDAYEWALNRRVARITSARISANARLDSQFFSDLMGRKPITDDSSKPKTTDKNSLAGILQNLNVNYNLALSRKYIEGVDTAFLTQNNIRLSGGTVNLTNKWRVTVGGIGYDFVRKTFTYPDFQLYRNLHCWEMGFSWQPQRGTYSFYIRVKQPSQLDFLNLPYRRNNYDPLGGF